MVSVLVGEPSLQFSLPQEGNSLEYRYVERPEPDSSAQALEAAAGSSRVVSSSYALLIDTDIRVLEFRPSATKACPLQFNIEHAPLSLARAKRYIALSYTWGPNQAQRLSS